MLSRISPPHLLAASPDAVTLQTTEAVWRSIWKSPVRWVSDRASHCRQSHQPMGVEGASFAKRQPGWAMWMLIA
jgi:hypothetical protein